MLSNARRALQIGNSISKESFLDSIARVCPGILQNGGLKLGIAVSGGVDSMALAVMCQHYLPKNGTNIHCLIVDHGLRSISSEEALQTQASLAAIGLQSKILKLDAEKLRADIGSGQKLETCAREARYKALVEYCQAKSIRNVFAAHHRNDQHETTLHRLSQSARRRLSMVVDAPLPESLSSSPTQIEKPGHVHNIPLGYCQGVSGITNLGIRLLRPLLRFDKESLIATCEHFGVKWATDETNEDPKLGPRNAIRYMISNHRLPEALNIASLARLAERQNDRLALFQNVAKRVFQECSVSLDTRTGGALVKTPAKEEVAQLLSTLLPDDIVDQTGPQWLAAELHALFADLVISQHSARPISVMQQLFLATERKTIMGSVYFNPRGGNSSSSWFIAPPPPRKGTDSEVQITIPPGRRSDDFQLFEQRWFVKVKHDFEYNVYLTYLRGQELEELIERLYSEEYIVRDVKDAKQIPIWPQTAFDTLLGGRDARLTLPVLVRSATHNYSWSALRTGQILAFPTLNLVVQPHWRKAGGDNHDEACSSGSGMLGQVDPIGTASSDGVRKVPYTHDELRDMSGSRLIFGSEAQLLSRLAHSQKLFSKLSWEIYYKSIDPRGGSLDAMLSWTKDMIAPDKEDAYSPKKAARKYWTSLAEFREKQRGLPTRKKARQWEKPER